jgi:hypothetical protein
MRAATSAVHFSVSRVVAWAPGVSTDDEWRQWARGERAIERDGEPRLEQMPAMLRRHAGRLGRMVCEVAFGVLDGACDIPVVLCSRYGEVERSVALLSALARGSDLSPTSFGLSVHNAVGGLFSMARRDTANCIALAGGDESAEYGMLETCGLFGDGAARVLLVVADCPLPAVYESFADVESVAFAWGCLVEPPGADALSLTWNSSPAHEPREPHEPHEPRERRLPAALSTLRFLFGASPEQDHHAGDRRWRWGRSA